MTVAIDANVLVYALDKESGSKHLVARDLMLRALDGDTVIPAQALAEFINVVRRKYPPAYSDALAQAEEWNITFRVVETTAVDVLSAARFAAQYRLQLWDSVVWQTARRAGAEWLLTEDLQDGLSLQGMTVLDPFAAVNQPRLRQLLTGTAPSPR